MKKPKPRRSVGDDDLDQNDPRRSTRERLVKLLTKTPDIRPSKAAEQLGISMTRVKQIATEEGFKLRWVKV